MNKKIYKKAANIWNCVFIKPTITSMFIINSLLKINELKKLDDFIKCSKLPLSFIAVSAAENLNKYIRDDFITGLK